MKTTEEKKKVMLNLCLPLIELSNNNIWEFEQFKELGMFFVKTKDGIFHLVEVDEGHNVNEIGLYPNICNYFTEHLAMLSVRDEMRSMITSLAESMREEFANSRKEMQSSVLEMEKWMNEDKDGIIEKLETLVESLKQSKAEDTSKVIQGYISESALVDVLRTIK